MSEYKRSLDELRELYLQDCLPGELKSEAWMFDAAIRAVKADELRGAADALEQLDRGLDAVFWDGGGYEFVTHWLRIRADEMEADS